MRTVFGVQLPSSGRASGAVGDGATREAALDDLREAVQALIAEVGIPDELTLTLDVA
jgi:hypothetical protein